MFFKRLSTLIGAASLIAAAIACSAPGVPAQTSTPTPTVTATTTVAGIFPTSQPGILSPTPPGATASAPTVIPLTAIPPTRAPVPTKAPVIVPTAINAKRVSFETGATQAVVTGSLAAGASESYVLRIMAGQLIQVSSTGTSQPQLTVTGADGTGVQNGGTFVQRAVPSNQDYIIKVTAGDQPVQYNLLIVIPQRVSFPAGATWTNAQGTLQAGQKFHYVMYLGAGQVLDVASNIAFTPELSLTGTDGGVIAGGGAGAFRGHIPKDGDYILTLTGGSQVASYDLSITVPARISFAAGATSATLTGSLDPHETIHYVIDARKGQTLDALFTPEKTAKMTIYGVDGTVLWSGMGEGTHWTGALPTDQDYVIVFQAGSTAVNYTLKVTIT